MIENDTWYRCTVCGREGRVGRCCGDETREPLNDLARRDQEKIKVKNLPKPKANTYSLLDDVVKLLTEYTQYLYKFGYLDDDWIMEASSPIQEFINKKFGNVV